jgi:hypothetical protein
MSSGPLKNNQQAESKQNIRVFWPASSAMATSLIGEDHQIPSFDVD